MNFILTFLLFAFGVVGPATAQTEDQIREAQTLLFQTDRNPGPIDGVWGRRTEAALKDFLAEQGVEFDGDLSANELEMLRSAPLGPKFRLLPYKANGRRIQHMTHSDGLTTFPGRDELPQYLDPPPNDITLGIHYARWLRDRDRFGRYEVLPAEYSMPFRFNLQKSAFLEEQLNYKSILSYIYFEDGEIRYDGLAPSDRFKAFQLDADLEFRSQSFGKSLVSYVVGHAICEGYIESVDAPLSDWPLIENTLYSKLALSDVLDMRARDQHVVNDDGFVNSDVFYNTKTIATLASLELDGTSPNHQTIWNYNGLATNIVMNYAIFKVGDDWQSLLDRVFRNHVGIQGTFFFQKHDTFSSNDKGPGWYSAYAHRYDYLRIGVTMLNDWKSDSCIGQYLRNIFKNRKAMNHRFSDPQRLSDVAQSYGGQFWFDLKGMKNRPVFAMNGNNGQNVLVDMENSRVVVVNAAHTNFDWRVLVYDAIRYGRLPD